MQQVVKVLIIDDSALMRRELTRIINAHDDLVVVGAAMDAEDGLSMISRLDPDVVTIDVNLPGMDGIACLQHIMITAPRPCVMISGYTRKDSLEAFEALELGAVDFLEKPSGEISRNIMEAKDKITRTVCRAASANVLALSRTTPVRTIPGVCATPILQKSVRPLERIVVIGVSTGGPRTLMAVIPHLSRDLAAPVLVIQHMPARFTGGFAKRMNSYSKLPVKEARHGDELQNGVVYVCPGERNLLLRSHRGGVMLEIVLPEKEDMFVPSVEKTLNTAIDIFKHRTVGVILTGMGDDGVHAMARLHAMGGLTVAESKESAVIYGMPRAVIDRGVATTVVPAREVANVIEGALSHDAHTA
ncbi:two-component system, chemotaxis family, response regulator CheB [Desulfocicer vacuolatum DSM 3385]|uniref:Protein-glutamate methylesterase/protein-glutamine glutaminase n=1 Tax=Desulfocicer vacuolatum DSM 3385 TaxID=1121400 RepID=A0A1W2BE77_9BACT|nr:chemotaxis-specific protein-glutamate methyltransferase CheB [Desulfocicer vacuolatum]SMC71285.1 two-component system, chemotaxis family, response regulator CheB [Desulfocicer vacuolatum DSM 3385]